MVKISKEETGKRIRRLLAECGITVRDVQEELELDSPQSVYKWLKGKALPSLDNLLVLGCMLDLPVEQLLVLEGEEEKVGQKTPAYSVRLCPQDPQEPGTDPDDTE